MDKTSEMAIFAKVVQTGGFSAAGRELGITPSAISKQIGRLEDRLGARLLQRTTRRLSLTEEGRTFYQRCTRILASIEEAEAEITALHSRPRGLLRVNGSVAFTKHQVVPLMPEFLARYPDMHINIELMDRSVDLVSEGFDLAIRLAEPADSSLIVRHLATDRRVIVAAPSYLARHGTPSGPDDLLNHNCLRISTRSRFNDWEFDEKSGKRVLHVQGNFQVNDGDSLHQAVLAGIGIGRLATYLVGPDIREGRLVPLLTDYVHERASIYVVYPHRRHLSPKVRAFVDFLVEKFVPNPPWETHASWLPAGDTGVIS